MRIIYELKLWVYFAIKWLPGHIGSYVRCKTIPFASIGRTVTILEGVQIDYPSRLYIGNNVSINRSCTIHAGGIVSIFDNVLIGPDVTIYSQNHKYERIDLPIAMQDYVFKKTVIHEGAWIASNAIILPGVSVGRDSIVAAGSVVTKDVPDYAVVAGNPAKTIKIRNC